MDDRNRSIILRLFEIGAVKFGTFTLKSGLESPVYIDLRLTVSFPPLLRDIATALNTAAASATPYDNLCGVPYTALPFATAMSLATGRPMLMRRKEAKQHGTKRLIEGDVRQGASCLVVEDLVTSGLSVLETVSPLRDAGLLVSDVVVLLDRQQNARNNLSDNGITLHSVFTLTSMLDVLVLEGKLNSDTQQSVLRFISANQVMTTPTPTSVSNAPIASRLSYNHRANLVRNPVGRRLLNLMDSKGTNLAVAADVTTTSALLSLAKVVGPYICMLKTHADIISDWTADTGKQLRLLAKEHDFLIFEDRKFADIGSTVQHQLRGGVHAIASWADIVNAHSIAGPGIISGLAKGIDKGREIGIALLAEMSSEGNLATALPEYKSKTVDMARQHSDAVFGFISMGDIAGAEFVHLTPGVNLSTKGDALGQQYASPENVIGVKGSDVIIVGRGIYKADDQAAAAQKYQQSGWEAYKRHLHMS